MFKKTIAVICVGLIALFIPLSLMWGDTEPALMATTVEAAEQQGSTDAAGLSAHEPAALQREEAREVLAPGVVADSRTQRALCGFTGRIVDADDAHIPDTGVRLYRLAWTEFSQLTLPRAGTSSSRKDFLVGAVQTDAAGVFTITGAPPRGTFMLQGGIGTDAPTNAVTER